MKYYYYLEEDIVKLGQFSNDEIPNGAVEVSPADCTFLKPSIVEGDVVESATLVEQEKAAERFFKNWNSELTALPKYTYPFIAQKLVELTNAQVVRLTKRAYEIALDKTGDMDYLKQQRDLYELKKSVADGTNTDEAAIAWLQSEAGQEGLLGPEGFEVFKQIIIDKWNASYAQWSTQMLMIERGRTKILTLIEQNKIESAIQAIYLATNLLDQEDAENIFNQILNLGNED